MVVHLITRIFLQRKYIYKLSAEIPVFYLRGLRLAERAGARLAPKGETERRQMRPKEAFGAALEHT